MDKILVVDDMQQNVMLMSSYLQSGGYNVISSNTGAGAIKTAQMMKPSLIVLDLIMPDMSGYDVCRLLKSNPDTRDIIILVVTAMDSKESRFRAFQMGADDYLTKPFDKDTLMAKVKSLSRVKELTDELEKQYSAMKEKNYQLELQLKMARQVQQALITQYKGEINGINVVSRYMPAMDIGGDYYEVCKLDDKTVGVFMADVSGHGISAALLTSMVKLMFKGNIFAASRPDILLARMNKEFCGIFGESDIDFYSCAFFASIDTQERKVTYSNAGHALPLRISISEGISEIELGGIPLGLMEAAEYTCGSYEYGEDESILFYTDGLSDSFYKDSPEDFLKYLRELLDTMAGEDPEDIIGAITEHFYNYDESAQYENDDVSMILCKLN